MTIHYDEHGARTHTYDDGIDELVREGDLITTQQWPGGMLPPAEPTTGRAVKFPHSEKALAAIEALNAKDGYRTLDPDELVCESIYRPGTPYERIRYTGIHRVVRAA